MSKNPAPVSRLAIPCALLLSVILSRGFVAQAEQLVHHKIQTDSAGNIIPWYSPDPGKAYDHAIMSIWKFWKNMKSCPNGVKYYLQHQVWRDPEEDTRGLGGDQISMALSSWNLLYAYSGDRSVIDDMTYMADFWIKNGFSGSDASWPNMPYPYNSGGLHSGRYDGDMRAGPGYLQPDKAGSFAAELTVLYQITGNEKHLKVAIEIADTLAAKVIPGDGDHSPWPYRVHAVTGQISLPYTTNYTGVLSLFDSLIRMKKGDGVKYASARDMVSAWLKKYPMRTNKWGPFFEDVPGWSDSEINGDTMAMYILENPEWDLQWKQDAKAILEWSAATFGNTAWAKFGVTAINEQTAYLVPGNSHTSRHASVQLLYAEKAGDTGNKAHAIRQLHWATYMVGDDGKNRYPYDDVWLTDGYGDYVRHYLRAMGAAPELAPRDQNHLLRTTSVIQKISYGADSIAYKTCEDGSQEVLRIMFYPAAVLAGGTPLPRLSTTRDLERRQGYVFETEGDAPGVLRIRHEHSGNIEITGRIAERPPMAVSKTISLTPGTPVPVTLSVNYEGSDPLIYTLGGPFYGKISGAAPNLLYTPMPDFTGTDVLTFRARDARNESNPANVTFKIARQNLARVAGVKPFTTEDPRSGNPGVEPLPALNDDDVRTSVAASAGKSVLREVSVGVIWTEPQSVRQVVYQQGRVVPGGQGAFTKGFRLQISMNGQEWQDAAEPSLSPAPYSWTASDMLDYIFTMNETVQCRGVRITGSVASTLRTRELQVYATLGARQDPKIEYHPQNQTAHEGERAIFGVRAQGTVLMTFQWQKSKDKGQNWTDIPGANGSYYETPVVRFDSDNGIQFRCSVSNGTAAAVSNPAELTVIR